MDVRIRLVPALLGLLGPTFGCACGEPPGAPPEEQEDRVEFELFDHTRVLEGGELDALVAVDDDGTLRFSGTPTALAELEQLDVILATPSDRAPAGLMRLVLSTEEDADGLVVHTVNAPIQLAFSRLDVRLHGATPTFDDPTHVDRYAQALTVGDAKETTYTLHEPVYDVDGNPDSPDDQVYADGTLHAGLAYEVMISFDWLGVESGIDSVKECLKKVIQLEFDCDPQAMLPEVKAGLWFDADADAALALQGVAFLGYDAGFPVYHAQLPLIVYPPLVFVPTITVKARFHGEGASEFSFAMAAEAAADGGLEYSSKDGLDPDWPEFSYDFSVENVDAVLSANSSVAVGPELKLLLYGVFGPVASLLVGARLDVDRDEDPCYRLLGTVGGEVGVYVGFEGLPGFQLFDERLPFSLVETEFDSGDCLPLPNNGAPSPTAGASDLTAFQDPQFTRFARVLPGTLNGMPIDAPGAQAEWSDLVATVDGRFWMVGSDAEALVSMEPSGDVLWARRFTADVPFWPDIGDPKLLMSRAAPMSDGTMLVAAYPYTLLRLSLAGELLWARRFMKEPFKETWLRFTDLVQDTEGGFYLVGHVGESYSEAYLHDTWLMRLDADGDVVWSRRISAPGVQLSAQVLVPDQDGVLVIGNTENVEASLDRGAAVRVDKDGAVVWAKELIAQNCDDAAEQRLYLTSAQTAMNEDVLAAGHIVAWGYESAVLRIQPDGDVPFSASHRSANDAQLGPTLTSMVELPTSGFLVAGNYAGDQATHDWYLAGLDSAGQVQWAWTLGGHDNPADDPINARDADTYPSITLTQDGGALLFGFSESITPDDGSLIVKVPARSGALALDATALPHYGELSLAPGDTCVVAQPLTIEVADDAVAPIASLGVFVEDAALVPVDITAGE